MDLYHWQQRFEAWLSQHHGQEDAAHDISHFRRVWATAQQLAEETAADRLVILTACYFHDIVSLAKNHPERSRSSAMAAEKTLAILQSAFPDFRNATRRFYTRLKPTVLARQLLRKAKKRKSSRMPIALRRWGR
jgi:HD superfamily phosphodiesterase